MRFASATVALVTSSGLAAVGCAHDRIAWPPTAPDVARINDGAAANDWFRVEYVESLPPASNLRVDEPIAIATTKPDQILFRARSGETRAVAREVVTGVTVKQRGRGAASGAAVGLAVGALVVGFLYVLGSALSGGYPDGPPPDERPSCDDACVAKGVAPLLAAPAVIGAVVGWFVGYRHTFDFAPP